MKKVLILAAAMLMSVRAIAVPACPAPATVSQPDGSTIVIELHGDEFYHFNTTADGYTVMKNANGYYVYAVKDAGGTLVASEQVAHDKAQRGAAEQSFLSKIEKGIVDNVDSPKRLKAKSAREARRKLQTGQFDYSNFKGLVILINYTDVKFRRSDVNEFYNRMINERNYNGFVNEDGSPNRYGAFTGSVRDYYYDNSLGMYDPSFEVVGPIDVNYASTDAGDSSRSIFLAAVNQAINDGLDLKQFDADHNGVVDMVYFIVAGGGSHFSGNDSNLLWPYMSSFYNYISSASMRLGLYACSVEMYGPPSYNIIDGIGTMCHEFSHVLGLPDLYDTNYADGGQSHDPGAWDIMSGGSYNNYSRTPVGYSLYDRMSLGFSEPKTITSEGSYTLQSLGATGEGYKLLTPTKNEFFLLENRQNSKWDNMSYMPGHGMIVARVDSTNVSVWEGNSVNANSKRNYYELLRAGNGKSGDLSSDPFPGTDGVTMLTNITTPSLRNYNNQPNDYNISAITERGGVITFSVVEDGGIISLVEDFETLPAGETKTEKNVQGAFARWDFTSSAVVEPTTAGLVNDSHGVGMVSPSMINMSSDVYLPGLYMISVYVKNPTTSAAKYRLAMSTDQGATWTPVTQSGGDVDVAVSANSDVTLSWNYTQETPAPVRFRLNQTAGARRDNTYIDDITFFYDASADNDEILVGSVIVSPATAQLAVGETLLLTATVLPGDATNKTLTWLSSDETIATVDRSGVVTAKAEGSVTITAMSNDSGSVIGTCTLSATSGIIDLVADSISATVRVDDKTINVEGEFDGNVRISDARGALLHNGTGRSVTVVPGIYIVTVGGKSVKVAVR